MQMQRGTYSMPNGDSGQYLKQFTTLSDSRDYAFEARWRTDGQAIAFTQYSPVIGSVQRYQRVYIQDVTKSAGSGALLNRTETDSGIYESCPSWNPSGTAIAYLKSYMAPSGSAIAQVWRQSIDGVIPSSDSPRQWVSFSAWVPAFQFSQTQRRPMIGASLAWH